MSETPQIPATFDAARESLSARLVGLTPRSIKLIELAVSGAQSGIDAVQTVTADLAVGLVLDQGESVVPVSQGMLAQWGISIEEAIADAIKLRLTQQPGVQQVESVFVVSGEAFCAHALLAPQAVAALIDEGRPVMMVAPVTDRVVVAPADDPAAFALALQVAERLLQSPSLAVSVTPLLATPTGWVACDVPADAAPVAGALNRTWSVLQYDAQRAPLQSWYDASNSDVFVAAAVQAAAPDGQTVSYATLAEGTRSLLPLVDDIVLIPDQGAPTRVSLSQLQQIPGLLQPVPDLTPTLLEATRFPHELL